MEGKLRPVIKVVFPTPTNHFEGDMVEANAMVRINVDVT
jgi:hypothetical protein